jgi:Asp-tRNA(Asn)/Glu-tRNA(Gln) amidotransferase A subunit family amidase
MYPRFFGIFLFGCVLAVTGGRSATTFDLSTATIADINAAFDAGALTSEKLVQLYLTRIAAYDQKGPALNTVITLNLHALEEARSLDAERKTKGPRSPLHGTAIVLKDLFDTADMPTSGGFLPMTNSQPVRDAFIVKRLREAGAIILAKVNLNDWFGQAAWGASTRLGQTRNPYDPTRVPGGSSGGPGASVAAWFATAGIGSETGISIRNPTSENNLVGLAATQGLISRTGQICSSFSQERGGPMARSVYDVAVLLDAIAGFDAEDLITADSLGKMPAKPYVSYLDSNGLNGARLGVLRELFKDGPMHRDGRALMDKALADLQRKGSILVDPVTTGVNLPTYLVSARVSTYERRFAFDKYFARLGPDAPIRSVVDLVAKGGKWLKPGTAALLDQPPLDRDRSYLARLQYRDVTRQLIIELMDRFQLDAIVYPFKTRPATKIGEPFSTYDPDSDNPLSAITGLPALLVPIGFTSEGLPIAMEILGRPYSEPTLLKLGYAYEHATKHRKPPQSTPALPNETFSY